MAKKNQDPAKTTFLVRHEKLGVAPWGKGKNKVDRINRCYIGRLDAHHVEPVREKLNKNKSIRTCIHAGT